MYELKNLKKRYINSYISFYFELLIWLKEIYIYSLFIYTTEREFSPLKSVKDNYPKLVLSMDNLPESNVKGIKWKK